MIKKFNILILVLLSFFIISCSLNQSLEDALREAIDTKKFGKTVWTVMVYMCADNNLNPYSILDINEMIQSGGSNKNLNIVVLWDQTSSYPGGNRHGYYLIKSSGPKLLKDVGEINMGWTKTAKDFIDYVYDNFRADKYIFVFWDHGNGVDKSIIRQKIVVDDWNDDDNLEDWEQVEILQYFYTKMGKKIDILVYDACVMGLVELMYQTKDYARYFIGSEDSVPFYGMNYKFLREILYNPDISSKEIAKKIVSYYPIQNLSGSYPFFEEMFSFITLSAIDLSKIATLSTYLSNFSEHAVTTDRNKSCFFYAGIKNDLTFYFDGENNVYVDIYYYMDNVIKKLIEANDPNHPAIADAQNIMNWIEKSGIVINECYGSDHIGKANGISIYLEGLASDSPYRSNTFNLATSWSNFLDWIH